VAENTNIKTEFILQTSLTTSVNWTQNILYHLDGSWLKCHNFWLFSCIINLFLLNALQCQDAFFQLWDVRISESTSGQENSLSELSRVRTVHKWIVVENVLSTL
jgi:hypothetical protein